MVVDCAVAVHGHVSVSEQVAFVTASVFDPTGKFLAVASAAQGGYVPPEHLLTIMNQCALELITATAAKGM